MMSVVGLKAALEAVLAAQGWESGWNRGKQFYQVLHHQEGWENKQIAFT